MDAGSHQVRRYTDAAARIAGNASASDSFELAPGNPSPSDLATDGSTIWVTDDSIGGVFVYDVSGSFRGSWRLDAGNLHPSGITVSLGGGTEIWVLDRATLSVYEYDGATAWTDSNRSANRSFPLAPSDRDPEGIADPPSLFDDFNRPDGTVGNGWSTWRGSTLGSPEIQLSQGQLKTLGFPNLSGGIYRDLPVSLPMRFSFDFRTFNQVDEIDPSLPFNDGGWWISLNADPSSSPVPYNNHSQVTFYQYAGSRFLGRTYWDGHPDG